MICAHCHTATEMDKLWKVFREHPEIAEGLKKQIEMEYQQCVSAHPTYCDSQHKWEALEIDA